METRSDPRLAGALCASDWPRAARILRRAAAAKGAGASTFYNLALVLARMGEVVQPGHWLRRAVGADPRHQAAWFELGRWLLDREDFSGALEAFGTACCLCPADADAHLNAGRLAARLGRAQIAAGAFRALLALRPEAREARLGLLAALSELRDADAASLRAELAAEPAMRADLAATLTRGPRGTVSLDPARLG
jgi:tetratricopeptide (TPR) repeat protein